MRPLKVKQGNAVVRVYRTKHRDGSIFQVRWKELDKWKTKSRKTLSDAKTEARRIVRQLNLLGSRSKSLPVEEVERAITVRDAILEHQEHLPSDNPVRLIEELADCYRILSGGASPADACKEWMEKRQYLVLGKDISEAITEFLTRQSRKSVEDQKKLKTHLYRFKDAFESLPLADLTDSEISEWIDEVVDVTGKPLGQRNKLNHVGSVIRFFRWCEKQKYVHRGFASEVRDRIGQIDLENDTEVTIFTAEEAKCFLRSCKKEMIAFLAINFFAGLRTSEVERLQWEDIDFENDEIFVKGGIRRKARIPRTVPILPVLKSWLAVCRKESGSVWEFKNTANQIVALTKKAGIDWKYNAARHSYASYRLALVRDERIVASELGHSPDVTHNTYKRVISRKLAEEWFSLTPEVVFST